jgi:hypothetical protein
MDEETFRDLVRIVDNWLRAQAFPDRERVAAAAVPGRTLLIAGDPDTALRLFEHMSRAVSPGSPLQEERYQVLANRSYAHVAIARKLKKAGDASWRSHAEAGRDLIVDIKDFERGRPKLPGVYAAWHAMSLAEAHRLLGDDARCRAAVREAAGIPGQLRAEWDHFVRLYPDLESEMEEALKLNRR